MNARSMKIELKRLFIVELFCHCREAARSLHRLLDPANSFAAFKKYYHEKLTRMRILREKLIALIPPELQSLDVTVDQIDAHFPFVSFLHWAFGSLFARWKTSRTMPVTELIYVLRILDSFFQLCDGQDKPNADTLISLRMKMTDCEIILERRCYGLPEMMSAKNIDHFDKTPWLPSKTLAQILDKAA